MRVTTQLIDTETGADVWAMRFDRQPGDIFSVQDELPSRSPKPWSSASIRLRWSA